jgi:hypothetical protein
VRNVFETSMLRSILSPKRDKTVAGWRKLHNEDLHYLYSSNIIGTMEENRMDGACDTNGRADKCIQSSSRKTRRKETTRKT